MKKFVTLGFVMICMLMLSGCTKVIPLTEDESYLIAEYAADPVFPQMIYIFDHKDVGFSNVSVNNILKTVFLT